MDVTGETNQGEAECSLQCGNQEPEGVFVWMRNNFYGSVFKKLKCNVIFQIGSWNRKKDISGKMDEIWVKSGL